jgi:hypothetical protein
VEHCRLETHPQFFDFFVDGCQFRPIEAIEGGRMTAFSWGGFFRQHVSSRLSSAAGSDRPSYLGFQTRNADRLTEIPCLRRRGSLPASDD